MSPGRQAGMPEAGYTPPQRLFLEDGQCRVRFFSEQDPDEVIDYDFTTFPVARPLQEAFARAFDAHVGPAGKVNSSGAAGNAFRQLGYFIDVLVFDEERPQAPADLAPRHLKAFLLNRGTRRPPRWRWDCFGHCWRTWRG